MKLQLAPKVAGGRHAPTGAVLQRATLAGRRPAERTQAAATRTAMIHVSCRLSLKLTRGSNLMRCLYQRALALRQRRKRFIRRNTTNDVIIVPRLLDVRLLLDLEEVEVMDELAVLADLFPAREEVVDGILAHPPGDGVGIIGTRRSNTSKIMRKAGVDGSLGCGRHPPVQLKEAMAESPGFIVQAPIPSDHGCEAARNIEAHAVDIRQKQQLSQRPLRSGVHSELLPLLHGVDELTTDTRERHDLGAGALGLQQERTVVRRVHRMVDGTERLSANTREHSLRFRHHILAERIVRRDEEP